MTAKPQAGSNITLSTAFCKYSTSQRMMIAQLASKNWATDETPVWLGVLSGLGARLP